MIIIYFSGVIESLEDVYVRKHKNRIFVNSFKLLGYRPKRVDSDEQLSFSNKQPCFHHPPSTIQIHIPAGS